MTVSHLHTREGFEAALASDGAMVFNRGMDGSETSFDGEVRLRVRYQETDRMGVVYHSNHLIYFEVGRTELMRQRGIRYADLEAEGFILAVTEARARFLAPVTYDDELVVLTRMAQPGRARIRFDYRILNAETGIPVSEGHTEHAFLDSSGRIARIPDRIQAAISGSGL